MITISSRLKRALAITSCLTAIAPAAPLAAQTVTTMGAAAASSAKAGSEVEAVVVTAGRRQIDLQAAPLAISALGSSTLDKSFTNDLAGLNAVVPSLEITKSSGFENIVTIRGVGSETPENAPTTVPGVSVFVDGVYIANTVSLDETLFDINRIEVLRGPQGALYGVSSIGGAINIVSNAPKLKEFSGSGDVSAGNYTLTRARGEVNIPIGDTLALRISGQKYDHDGFTTNVAIPRFGLDDAHDNSEKAALLWQPNDSFTATLTGQWYLSAQHGAAQKNINDPQANPREVYQDYPSRFALNTQLYHLNMEWKGPWFEVKSVTAYQGLSQKQQEDSSRSAVSLIGAYDDVAAWNTRLKNFNEEFDILSLPGSKLEWIAGAFVLNQSSDQFVVEYEGQGTPTSLGIPDNVMTHPPSNLLYGNLTHTVRESYSGFGQATWHVTPKLRLTGGVRANFDSYTLTSNNFSVFSINSVNRKYSDSVVTWRGEADYDITPSNMVYASVAKGYKPGGLNGIYGQQVIPVSFVPETNTAYSIGAKNTFFDKKLKLNLDAFYYLYSNMQYIENDPVPFDGGMANIPSVHIYGIEAEGSYHGMDGRLDVNANIALETGSVNGHYFTIDSTVQNAIESQGYPSPCAFGGAYYNPACWAAVEAAARDIGGKTPPAMPKTSGSFNVAYRFDLLGGGFTPRFELVYRGAEWARIFNEPALDRVPAYTIVNLNFEYSRPNSPVKISLAVTNLTNEAGVNSRYTDPYGTGQTSQQFIPPRQIIGTVAYRF